MKTNMKRYARISLLACVVVSACGVVNGGLRSNCNTALGTMLSSSQTAAAIEQQILIAGGGGDGQESHGGKGGGHSHG